MKPSLATVADRLWQYALLARLDRPVGNFLLLWPMLWALWIAAEGFPQPLVLGVFVLGVLVMRAAGCVINDYADRNIDLHVKRTKERPLTAGRITSKEALIVFALLGLTAFGLVLLMNTLTIQLAFVGIVLAATYPFMKRYTYLPQVHLGAAFGWAVPMAFAAQTGTVPQIAWLVFLAAVIWATIYDTQYAMVDRDDDLKIGVKSTAILFGEHDRLIIGLLQLLMLACLVLIGVQAGMSAVYYWSVALGGLFFVYQQYLIYSRERDNCFRAFLNNMWFGGAIFVGVLLHYGYH
ncbi:4-hydroxybenzoate polyprenyltransferase [Alkalilimnicola ehrlichii]|uniref:4-hydroxybenzoate octaprenyltransferase n=1 Tax=Alkalilimnicola ehrlichii TaxID=351052 RepID=A0A3E0X3X3_9GAMM|nr:4-hydroxybenzoate octaprenyltransferase [Alkalilimnicola ehrlichii]RFA31175.1 4-hydroxybenzoate polyprenyltransferase [Alkalilimnicola ehrlichii]RFA39540.1 4-hydroxybenzoate polyprenyltransferase [Alkalilimnicola ehrlichii]